ncbi:hypothetical protein P4H32_26380 [Bacillus cereus]|nr:hypothetical protein [Bacillus cereus]
MSMEKISIAGKETKKHIQEALKAVFPGFKFSLTSDYDSVCVRWTDGPVAPDVQKVLNRFESYTRVQWKTDFEEATGYEWKGQLYIGARHLSTVRQLSNERKDALIAYMTDGGMDYFNATVFERVDAEREMIQEGKLDSVEPRQRPDLMRDDIPREDRRKKNEANPGDAPVVVAKASPAAEPKQLAQVIQFPKQRASAVREYQFYESLEAEQRLKFRALQLLFKVDADKLIESGLSVDEAFTLAAVQVLK